MLIYLVSWLWCLWRVRVALNDRSDVFTRIGLNRVSSGAIVPFVLECSRDGDSFRIRTVELNL